MPLILNIETATPICSVCVARDGQVVDKRLSKVPNSHASHLTLMIDDLLSGNNIPFSALDAVAVSSGPGSYTGLRIGLSVAKGLCYALEIPLIAIPTLMALALAVKSAAPEDAFYLAVVDARRMDVYASLYDHKGNEILETACVTWDDKFMEKLRSYRKVFVGGNAAKKMEPLSNLSSVVILDDIECDAVWMAAEAQKKFDNSLFENTAYFEPFYLKAFGAANNNTLPKV